MKSLQYTLIVLALGCGLRVAAQTSSKQDTSFVQEKITSLLTKNFDPFGKSALNNSISSISLNSTLNAGADAKLQANFKLGLTWSGSVTAEQQLGKTDSNATFYNFSKGIAPGTTISLSLQKIFWNPRNVKEERNTLKKLLDNFSLKYRLNRDTVSYKTIIDLGSKSEKEELKGIQRKLPAFLTFNFALSRASFNYTIDSVKLKKNTLDVFTPVIKLSLGIPTSSSFKSFLAISYLFSNNYTSGNSSTFLTTFGKTANLVSQTLIFGAPKQTVDHHASIEFKQSFGGDEPEFAIDPSITYGLSSKQLSIEMPLYFIKGATAKSGLPSGLQGGIDLGYLTGTDKLVSFKSGFGAQLIISVPFSAIPNIF